MTFTSVNPHDPADVIGEWQAAGADAADAVVGRAMDPARTWADTPGTTQAQALSEATSPLEPPAAALGPPASSRWRPGAAKRRGPWSASRAGPPCRAPGRRRSAGTSARGPLRAAAGSWPTWAGRTRQWSLPTLI